ncbi:Protein phosphatase Slingshot 1 [Merluccius polli]|uniref:protein-serine/threonine phosphatase n=1 Tax=Merluccius polli TaxID=89951 RepID=A0AA47MKF0_MERPO|nr:Protein phosphatase Slingshot 1 [Merluccius polli]
MHVCSRCSRLQTSFVMVKGAALVLQQEGCGDRPLTPTHHSFTGDFIQHLDVMMNTLRSEDCVRLAVRLESGWTDRARYMAVVCAHGCQDAENVLLGVDFLSDKDSRMCSVGMVLPLWSDTNTRLEGDGGFSVNTGGRSQVFKPVSVQAMWSALQVLHKAREGACRYNHYPGSGALSWTAYYESRVSSEQSCVNEWNAMTDLESMRPDSPAMSLDQPGERERTECVIKAKLRSIMMDHDLESVTSREIRSELEQHMGCNLKEYKELIDQEMLLILGQMDKATLIFDHLYLGSGWNASNLEDLQDCGVGYILNMAREVDNFFPETLVYHNVRVYDEESTDLLAHWNDTYSFIAKAKKSHSKCLVHCKMGVSRSVATVVAYAMKEYGWCLDEAFNYVKQKRVVAQPNAGFMRQLAEYEGILDPSKQRHHKRWRSEADPETSDDGQASGQGEETPVLTSSSQEEEEAWGRSSGMSLEVEPLDPLNYNYYFRRLSDSALESGPSTPVRGPPLLGTERIFIEIEDVERDALLEDEGFPVARPPPPGEGAATARACGRLDPMEDIRLRLEFSTLEEEDEEEAQKEEEEMAALARAPRNSGGEEEEEEEEEEGKEEGRLGLANLNTNNSNRLASKRSCPAAFDDSAGSQNPFKVKPSYQSCPECLRLSHGWRCDRPAVGRTHHLYTSRHCTVPSITLDPPGAGLTAPAGPASVSCTLLCGHRCRCVTCVPATGVSPATTAAAAAAPTALGASSPGEGSLDTEDPDGGQEIQNDEEGGGPRPADGASPAELADNPLVCVESAGYSY